MRRINERTGRVLLACLLSSLIPLSAADDTVTQPSEIEQLKQMLAEQQRQINDLRQALAQQQQQQKETTGNVSAPAASVVVPPADPAPVSTFRNLGQVASTTAILPHPAAIPVARALPALPLPQAPPDVSSGSTKNPCEADPNGTIPTYLRLGSVCIVPIGFMDLTPFWRDKNAGSSMGSNFGSVPYNNTPNGNLSEFHFSPQNSRLGFRVDGDWKGAHFIGYNEFDFNGTSGATNLAVSNGAFVPRLRLFWVDVRKGQVRVPGRPELEHADAQPQRHLGFAWRSVLHPSHRHQLHGGPHLDAPARRALSLSPERQGDFRLLRRAARSVHGRFGGRVPHYAACRSYGAYLQRSSTPAQNISVSRLSGPTHLHAGLHRQDRLRSEFALPLRNRRRREQLQDHQPRRAVHLAHHQAGGGLQFGFNVEIVKNFRLIIDQLLERRRRPLSLRPGAGPYCSRRRLPQPVHAGGTVDGFEARVTRTSCSMPTTAGSTSAATWRSTPTAQPVGYGYTGSANSQNRAINEIRSASTRPYGKAPATAPST